MSTKNNSINNTSKSLTVTDMAAARAGIVKSDTVGLVSALIDSNTDGQVLISSSTGAPAWANITSTSSTLVVTNGHNTLDVETQPSLQTPTGFSSWGGAGNYFDDTTLGSFTISRPGTGYIKGVPISWTAPQTITGMTAGNTYFIYIDNTGTIQKTSTRTDALFTDNVVLFECLRDSTPVTNNQLTVKENHPYGFPPESSNYLHDVIGSVINNSNNGANITINGTQGIQINGADTLEDHGLETTIPDSGGGAVTWSKYYTTAGGKWARQNSTNTFTGYYNNAGTPTALTAGKFAVYTLYVSKDNLTSSAPTYIAVLDNAEYNNQTAASTAIANGTTAKATNELSDLEIAQLGYIIYQQSTSSIVVVTISKATLKQTLSTDGTNTAALVTTNTTNFNGILSASNTNVQSALDTIDNWGAGTTNHAVVLGAGVGVALNVVSSIGSAGQLLKSAGASADPTWTTATYPTTIDKGDVVIGSDSNVVGVVATAGGTSGYVLTANGAGSAPTWQSIPPGGMAWQVITGSTQAMAINNGYISNYAGTCVLTLPSTCAVGTTFGVSGMNTALGWQLAQNAGQTIYFGAVATTTGVGGYLKSSAIYDSVTLVCNVANTSFIVLSSIGNITYV